MPRIDNTADLVAALEDRRKLLGLSKRDVAKRAGLSHSAYWFFANRDGDINVATLLQYCNVLGLSFQLKRGKVG